MSDRHTQVNEWFKRIASTWPNTDKLDLPSFPEDIPPVDYGELTANAKRVLNALDRRKAGRMVSQGKAEKLLF